MPVSGPSSGFEPSTTIDGFAFTSSAWDRGEVGLPGRARTVACAEGAVNRPHPGLSSPHTEGFNRRLRLPAT
jgi:hypothetical protein